jgi:hypothetical protein
MANALDPTYEAGWGSSGPPPVTSGFVLTTATVASISVNGSPHIPTRTDTAIPDGLRGVLVEFSSPGSQLHDLSPQVVAFNSRDKPISRSEGSLGGSESGLNGVFWQRPSPTPHGVCELSETHLRGLTAQWGHVVPRLRSFPDLLAPALLSCIDTEYYLDNWPLDAAVVLNASRPGAPPEPLYDFAPVPGHPGLVESPSAGQVARRVRSTWIVVEGGKGLQQRLTVIAHLRASVRP